MCKHCNKKDDLSQIAHESFGVGILGEIDVFLCMDGEKGFLYTGINDKEFKVKINYCPMCGRKIESEE